MTIIQLTDLHIGRADEDTYDLDVRGNFLKALEAVKAYKPDALVISGDLCYRAPAEEIYIWVKAQLDTLDIPVELISGNHDDPKMMASIFGLEEDLQEDGLYFVREIAGETVLFLETTPAEMYAPQLAWLKAKLAEYDKELIIFMHHPPLLSDVPFMDTKHAFKNRAEVQEIFCSHRHNLTIFTGHYHVDRTLRLKNMEVNITPSLFFQICRKSEEFAVDHTRPGYRIIKKRGEVLGHSVVYLD